MSDDIYFDSYSAVPLKPDLLYIDVIECIKEGSGFSFPVVEVRTYTSGTTRKTFVSDKFHRDWVLDRVIKSVVLEQQKKYGQFKATEEGALYIRKHPTVTGLTVRLPMPDIAA